jgi:hypothetical protein
MNSYISFQISISRNNARGVLPVLSNSLSPCLVCYHNCHAKYPNVDVLVGGGGLHRLQLANCGTNPKNYLQNYVLVL